MAAVGRTGPAVAGAGRPIGAAVVNYKKQYTLMLGFPPYGCLVCLAGWYALLDGLRVGL